MSAAGLQTKRARMRWSIVNGFRQQGFKFKEIGSFFGVGPQRARSLMQRYKVCKSHDEDDATVDMNKNEAVGLSLICQSIIDHTDHVLVRVWVRPQDKGKLKEYVKHLNAQS